MNKKDEALKLALEALEFYYDQHGEESDAKAIAAIRETLAEQPAQQQQEPVAWGVDWGKAGDQSCVSIIKRLPGGGIEVLATEYGPPASKPWVGLSEEDRLDIWKHSSSIDGAINATEAKLREKNA